MHKANAATRTTESFPTQKTKNTNLPKKMMSRIQPTFLALFSWVILAGQISFAALEDFPNNNTFQFVASYINTQKALPTYYIDKREATRRGWVPSRQNLWQVLPGRAIGGDVFSNRQNALPAKQGRTFTECDINYQGGFRGADRIVFSNDSMIFKTTDHYHTFEPMMGPDGIKRFIKEVFYQGFDEQLLNTETAFAG